MAGGTVHHGTVGDILPVVDEHGPEVDEAEQENVGQLLQGEDEREDVVWDTLGPAIQGMESVGRIWTRHDPFVMWLVQGLVHQRMVQTTVDPVDEEVGEANEQGELENAIVREGFVGYTVIQLCVTSNLSDKEWGSQQRHRGHSTHRLLDFQRDLVFQELGMTESCLVPNEDVRQSRNHEVNEKTENPDHCV